MERLTGEYKLPSPSYRELLAAHLLFYISNGEWSLVAASYSPGHHRLCKVLYNNAWCEESVSRRRQGGVRGERRVSKLGVANISC